MSDEANVSGQKIPLLGSTINPSATTSVQTVPTPTTGPPNNAATGTGTATTGTGSSDSTKSDDYQKKTFSNIDEILAAYGRYHRLSRFVILWLFVGNVLAWMSMVSSGDVVNVILKPVRPNSTYCHCPIEEHRQKQELLTKKSVLDAGVIKASVFGTLIAFGTASLNQSFGSRAVTCWSLLVSGATMLLFGFQSRGDHDHHDPTLNRIATIVQNFCNMHIVISSFLNAMEWLPRHVRPLAAVVSCLGSSVGRLVILLLAYFVNDYRHAVIGAGFSVLAGGVASYWVLRDTPYYFLSKSDSARLQKCFEYLESWGKDACAGRAEKLVDDVAFEVFEGDAEAPFAALWKALSTGTTIRTLSIILLLLWTSMQVRLSTSVDLDFGPFEENLVQILCEFVGYSLALPLIGNRRLLNFVVTSLVMAPLLIIMTTLTPHQFDHCQGKYTRTGAVLYAHSALAYLTKFFQLSIEPSIFLYSMEFLPTSARGVCFGLLYLILRTVELLIKKITTRWPVVAPILPIVLCLLSGLVLLVQDDRPAPMTSHFADLTENKDTVERVPMPPPLVSKSEKKTN